MNIIHYMTCFVDELESQGCGQRKLRSRPPWKAGAVVGQWVAALKKKQCPPPPRAQIRVAAVLKRDHTIRRF